MKYIKTYETLKKLNVGDYVLFYNKNISDIDTGIIYKILDMDVVYYQIIYKDENDDLYIIVSNKLVFRKLTRKEIKQYKLEIDVSKYNL